MLVKRVPTAGEALTATVQRDVPVCPRTLTSAATVGKVLRFRKLFCSQNSLYNVLCVFQRSTLDSQAVSTTNSVAQFGPMPIAQLVLADVAIMHHLSRPEMALSVSIMVLWQLGKGPVVQVYIW